MSLKEYKRAKQELDDFKQSLSRSEGKLEQLYEHLKELGCESLEEAQKLIAKLEKQKDKLDSKITTNLKGFKWKDKLR